MKMIAAVDENWAIGYQNKLLFSVPEDMKKFQTLTKESGVIIMGRKTFESIGKPLPGRLNIILSSKGITYQPKNNKTEYICFSTLEDILNFLIEQNLFEKAFVIGGESIYRLFEPYCSSIYITKFKTKSENADAYFPINLDTSDQYKLINESSERIYNNIRYSFCEYIHFMKYNVYKFSDHIKDTISNNKADINCQLSNSDILEDK